MTTPAYAFLTAGTDASGTGALVPGLPLGWAAGNIFILVTSARNNTETMSSVTAGWTPLSANLNVTWNFIYGRIAVGGDTAPTVTYSGSGQHHAQIGCWTGPNVYPDLTSIVSAVNDKYLPGSQVNILYDALLPLEANCLCLAFATKNKTSASDGSSVNDLAGFTRVGSLTTNGSNLATWWGYVQQTIATNIPAATQTRTGAAESLQYGTMYIALKTAASASHIAACSTVMNQG